MAPNYPVNSVNNKAIYFFAGRIRPYKTGGERYNYHLLRAAESLGLVTHGVALTDIPLYRILGLGPLWRLRHVWACMYLSLLAYRYRHERLFFDIWLAPYLWPWTFLPKSSHWLMVHILRNHIQSTKFQQRWVSWCEGRLLSRASRILIASNTTLNQLRKYSIGSVPISIINPGFDRIDSTYQNSRERSPLRLLFAGSMVRTKGVLDLLHACAFLPDEPLWELHLAGKTDTEPDTMSEVYRIISSWGQKRDRVTIHGWLDTQALQDLYATSDIFVLPSHWEGYGIVFLEAMAWRIPIISYNTGAIPEVVTDGKSGILVPLKDIHSLASAITRLMNDGELRRRLGEEGRKIASQHNDWQEMEIQSRDWFASGI